VGNNQPDNLKDISISMSKKSTLLYLLSQIIGTNSLPNKYSLLNLYNKSHVSRKENNNMELPLALEKSPRMTDH